MAASYSITYYKNDDGSTFWESGPKRSKSPIDSITSVGLNWGGSGVDWSRSGYSFVEWNTLPDGYGVSYQPNALPSDRNATLHAIWQEDTPTDYVTITYNNETIGTISSSGSVVLATAGTYLTDDITITYQG